MSEKVPGLEFETLTPWFSEHVAPVKELAAKVVGHGRSNITYRMEADGQAWVLRRPPLSHVLPTAHDMKREFRVISALEGTAVPVPHAIALCEDKDVIGAPFYVMSFVEGFVPTDPRVVAEKFDEAARRRLGEELIDTLVAFHAVDPASVGLADFGKPEGYIARQVRRFTGQLEQSTVRKVPELEELGRRIARAVPQEADHTLVHGDYRLDNCVVSEDGHIAAVLDWEMATLGDPLADVGSQYMYWPEPGGAGAMPAGGVSSGPVLSLPGFPTRSEALARYAEKSGRDVSQLDFYAALAFFRLAVILEGIHARYLEGGTVGAGFETMAAQVLVLTRQGLAVTEQSSIAALRG
jgi:aminoglycoside phosphotransferase (APT) family kinase protein